MKLRGIAYNLLFYAFLYQFNFPTSIDLSKFNSSFPTSSKLSDFKRYFPTSLGSFQLRLVLKRSHNLINMALNMVYFWGYGWTKGEVNSVEMKPGILHYLYEISHKQSKENSLTIVFRLSKSIIL